MNANLMLCRNEVFIEGGLVGPFETFEFSATRQTLGNTAQMTIPLYAIGVAQQGEARSRTRRVFSSNVVKPCAKVEVYCWYEGQERIKVFSGFIEHVEEGFPTKLHLQDNTFILRFGQVQRGWDGSATTQSIVRDCIPIAEEAFKKEREVMGFTAPIPSLTYTADERNVQAVTTSLSFRNWGARSPYDTLQKLMQLLVLYGGVTDDYNVYIGAWVRDNTSETIGLDTRYNVIGRQITPVDGRFVDYDVKVSGILDTGRKYTATGGYGTSRQRQSRSNFEKNFGETYRGFTPLKTVGAIQDYADKVLDMLRGFKNKGTITLLMYPKVNIMDWVLYNDSLFPELSAGYFVLGYRFQANDQGYFQTLEVTDRVFAF